MNGTIGWVSSSGAEMAPTGKNPTKLYNFTFFLMGSSAFFVTDRVLGWDLCGVWREDLIPVRII